MSETIKARTICKANLDCCIILYLRLSILIYFAVNLNTYMNDASFFFFALNKLKNFQSTETLNELIKNLN